MRTTVDLEEPVLRRARRKAEQQRRTLSQLVQEAVTTYLARDDSAATEPFALVTCGAPGGYAPTPREMAEVTDGEDSARLAGIARPRDPS